MKLQLFTYTNKQASQNNSNYRKVSFKGLSFTDAIYDAALLKKYGTAILNKLPEKCKQKRAEAVEELYNSIYSDTFFKDTHSKNWEMPMGEANAYFSLNMLDLGGLDYLKERGDILLTKTYLTLKDLYKSKNEIVIPFSGGRDSTAILASSLTFFPNKKYKLITILNGITSNPENTTNQVKYIRSFFSTTKIKPKIEHIFIDTSKDTKKYVLNSAENDKKILGNPAICSSCKFVMEKNIWKHIIDTYKNKKPPILMGYNKSQAEQSWLEQTYIQRLITANEAQKQGIKVLSPLFNIIETPFDSRLLLTSMGIPLKNQKNEMKCFAAGLNPDMVDYRKQIEFSVLKNSQTNAILNRVGNLEYIRENDFATKIKLYPQIEKLKQNKDFTSGSF